MIVEQKERSYMVGIIHMQFSDTVCYILNIDSIRAIHLHSIVYYTDMQSIHTQWTLNDKPWYHQTSNHNKLYYQKTYVWSQSKGSDNIALQFEIHTYEYTLTYWECVVIVDIIYTVYVCIHKKILPSPNGVVWKSMDFVCPRHFTAI